MLREHHGNLGLDPRVGNLSLDWAAVSSLVNLDLIYDKVTQPVFATELKTLMNQYYHLCAAAKDR